MALDGKPDDLLRQARPDRTDEPLSALCRGLVKVRLQVGSIGLG